MTESDNIIVTEDQRKLPLEGLIVDDAVLLVQIIEKLVKSGTITGSEIYPIGLLRERTVQAIKFSSNKAAMTAIQLNEGNN